MIKTQELLMDLSKAKKPVKELSEVKRELFSYREPSISISKLPILVISGIYIGIFLLLLNTVGVFFLRLGDKFLSGGPMITFIVLVLLLVISAVGGSFSFSYIDIIQIKRKQTKNKDRIQKLQTQQQELINFLISLQLPRDYLYPNAIDKFEFYLINHRAKNINECINLYIQELQHNEKMNALHKIQNTQEAILSEVSAIKYFS